MKRRAPFLFPRRHAAAALLLGLLAPAAAADPYRALAKALTKRLGEAAGKQAAVVPFAYVDGRPSAGGAAVAGALQTELVGRGKLRLVERERLDRVLEELKLQQSGLVSTATARQVGLMSGADLLVTGTLAELGRGKVEVQARLIRVESGEVLRAAKATVKQTWEDFGPPALPPSAGAAVAGGKYAVAVARTSTGGARRRVGERELAIRYAHDGKRPLLRIHDFTDPKEVDWKEVAIEFDPLKNRVYHFSRGFSVGGKSYRLWCDAQTNLHLAPVKGLFGGADAAREVVLPFYEALTSWTEEMNRSSFVVAEPKVNPAPIPSDPETTATVEPMGEDDVRVSLWAVWTDGAGRHLRYAPLDAEVVSGRRGGTVSTRLLKGGSRYFRFHYRADTRGITVEEVR